MSKVVWGLLSLALIAGTAEAGGGKGGKGGKGFAAKGGGGCAKAAAFKGMPVFVKADKQVQFVQQDQPRRGQFQPGGFGGFGAPRELLSDRDIEALSLSSDQKTKVEKIVKDYSERTGRPMFGLPGGDGVVYHGRNFFDSVRSRKPTVANAEVMFHSMSTVHAANITMWLKRDMKYDPSKMEFADADANGFRQRVMREPWVV